MCRLSHVTCGVVKPSSLPSPPCHGPARHKHFSLLHVPQSLSSFLLELSPSLSSTLAQRFFIMLLIILTYFLSSCSISLDHFLLLHLAFCTQTVLICVRCLTAAYVLVFRAALDGENLVMEASKCYLFCGHSKILTSTKYYLVATY